MAFYLPFLFIFRNNKPFKHFLVVEVVLLPQHVFLQGNLRYKALCSFKIMYVSHVVVVEKSRLFY